MPELARQPDQRLAEHALRYWRDRTERVEAELAVREQQLQDANERAERYAKQWLCDCHTWPDPDEAHAYIVALERRLTSLREALKATEQALTLWEQAVGEINTYPPIVETALAMAREALAAAADQQDNQ